MNQALITVGPFLIPDEKFSEPVHPGMGAFHGPAAGQVSFLVGYSALHENRDIPPFLCRSCGRFAGIALISRDLGDHSLREVYHDCVQNRTDLFGIMPVGSGDDHGERSAAPVGENMALGSFFFPGRWGCFPPLPGPEEP